MNAAYDAPRFAYVLRMGDNALILGQRLSEWTAHGPILEEDLASTNVALDLIGHARMWLDYAAEIEGAGRDADALAYCREQRGFCNVLLVERANGTYADTIARQFVFDVWHLHALQALCASNDARIAAIAAKAVREVAYHVARSGDWVLRLGDGTDESHARMQAALEAVWPYTGELFAGDAIDAAMLANGVGFDPGALRDAWLAHVRRIVTDATLGIPADGFMHAGGKTGRHSEALSYLLAEMQSVVRAIPAQRW